ncbi:hypothetical protein BB559_004906 [Furculomyces boomerangus]|uniref:Protein ORM1 n=2 Tax=Harpellales TaxID=61421 RepID=A0A2T9YC00_9FUNG|nr:hypothetical protein BB559_004906 [Furculomyces boomerangus]PWA03270.1 hypothetical protein BB558_000597 [Smittium angustum]
MNTIFKRVQPSTVQNEGTVNMNSTWINLRGSWMTNIFIIVSFRVLFGIIPWISTRTAWTLTNLGYCLFQYIMFHGIVGTPFEVNQGEFDELTMWEQLDSGTQFTPSKKFLFAAPIVLFLVSTHYCNYDIYSFSISLVAVLIVLIAKLPALHRVRFFGINVVHND